MSVTLVHVSTGQPLNQGVPLLSVDKEKKLITFFTLFDKEVMSTTGIPIPAIERPLYGNKVKVVLGDPEFFDAFTKIYLASHYTDKKSYKWCKAK